MVKIRVNVTPGECAICGAKGDTVLADCHVLYKGEWITQAERVCLTHVVGLVKPEKVEKEEPKPEKKATVKAEKKDEVKEATFYAGKKHTR